MITQQQFEEYAKSPAKFRNDLQVDVSGSIRRFGDVMDDWQRTDFKAIDPGLMKANGRMKGWRIGMRQRHWLGRPRGHSKTTDQGANFLWFTAFATRPVKGYFFAADKDQAALPKQQAETFIRLNRWLSSIVEVQKNRIVNIAKGHPGEGSYVELQSSDVASSYGLLADMILAEEITHWSDSAEALWHSILSTAAKRSNCLLIAIGNAGFQETWQWKVREAARMNKDWYFSELNGPQASWVTEQTLAEQRKMLPGKAFDRLWLNRWSTSGGDALTPEDIEAAFIDGMQPMNGSEKDYYFVGGSDLGISRDHSAFVVLAIPIGGRSPKIRLAHNKLWKPVHGQKINLLEVERHILECDKKFNLQFVAFDPWQHEALAQQIEADTSRKRRNIKRRYHLQPFMREVQPTPTNLRQQASLTIESFQDHRFQFYPCEPLKRDLHRLRVEEKSYGFRLVSPRDGEGHGDTASAFCLALLLAHEMAGKKKVVLSSNQDNSHVNAIDRRMEAERKEAEYWAERERQDPTGILAAMESGKLNTFTHGF